MNFRIKLATLIILIYCSSVNLLAQEWFPTGATWIYNNQMILPFQAHGIRKYVAMSFS